MEEKKLTDEEIISDFTFHTNAQYNIAKDICKNALDLINRQKAEIDRLKDACECFQEIILSMQRKVNNRKGVMVIHEIEQKKDGE